MYMLENGIINPGKTICLLHVYWYLNLEVQLGSAKITVNSTVRLKLAHTLYHELIIV